MNEKRKVQCPVCGALAEDDGDLCSAGRLARGQLGEEPNAHVTWEEAPGSRPVEVEGRGPRRRGTPSVEIVFCEEAGRNAKHSCLVCGRQAASQSLLCLPSRPKSR